MFIFGLQILKLIQLLNYSKFHYRSTPLDHIIHFNLTITNKNFSPHKEQHYNPFP